MENLTITLPNFFIIGAAKCGTTTLFNVLNQHPQVYIPTRKELRFFSDDDKYQKGIDWYSSTYFKDASHYPARGDGSTHYLYWGEKVAPRIKEAYNNQCIKFIAIFRQPAKRAYSFYWQMVRYGWEDLSFEESLERENLRLQSNWNSLFTTGRQVYGYYRGGCYSARIQPFLQTFNREQFHFLLQEDLHSNFNQTIVELLDFLAIDSSTRLKPVVSNVARMHRSLKLKQWLDNPSRSKYVLKRFLPSSYRRRLRKAVRLANIERFQYPPMNKNTEQYLLKRFENDIRQLEIIIKRDLSHWYRS